MKKLCMILFMVSLLLGVVLFDTMAGRAASVTVSAGTAQAAPDSEVQIPIMVQGAPGIGAMHIELTYDATVLEAKTVDKGQILSGNSLMEFNSTRAGKLVISIATLDYIKGDGALLNVHFVVHGKDGQASAISLENVRAWEGENGHDVLVKTQDGELTVKSAVPWWLLLLAVVIVAVLVLVAVRRRRRKPA